MKTSFWNHSLQPSTHSSLAVPNQHTHVRESTKKIQSFIMLRQQSYTFTSSRTSSSAFDIPQKKNLRVMTVNCSSVINKKNNLEVYINYIKPDVICRSESWLNNNIKSSEIFPENYTAYRKDRNTAGGGVFLRVRKDIVSSNQPDLDSDCNILWAKRQLQNKKIMLIGSFYMPHRCNNTKQELNKSLTTIAKSSKQKQIILCGDFNCPDISWK